MTGSAELSRRAWYSRKEWAIDHFGVPLYRVPVDPGWGCPHKPRNEIGGCTFCAEDGARARQITGVEHPVDQVRKGISFVRERYGEGGLELYVQAYTATNTSVARLRSLVEPLLQEADFLSLSIGTRPDCLPEEMLDLLSEWRERLEVWVEPGVQSSHDPTLCRINRQHTWAQSRDVIRRLHARGIQVCPHLLFGLPGESADEMFETLDQVMALPISAVKLHNLHVLKGSTLGEQWSRHPFPVLKETDWLALVMQLLRRIPADLPVFRVFTDSPIEMRLAPNPEFPKGRFLHEVQAGMQKHGWWQGELWAKSGRISRSSSSGT